MFGSYGAAPASLGVAFVSQASIDQLNSILSSRYGFTGAGGGAQVPRKNPLVNVFGRIDANLPWNTRLVLRHNYADADNSIFSRGADGQWSVRVTGEHVLKHGDYVFLGQQLLRVEIV